LNDLSDFEFKLESFDRDLTWNRLRYGLENDYKINLEANHGTLAGHTGERDTAMASSDGYSVVVVRHAPSYVCVPHATALSRVSLGEHETAMAHVYGMLGSIDANRNEAMLGWDTDMFPNDVAMSTYIMKCAIAQGGLQPGGLNFDAKVVPSFQTRHQIKPPWRLARLSRGPMSVRLDVCCYESAARVRARPSTERGEPPFSTSIRPAAI